MSSIVSTGSIAIAIAMCLRINGMSQWIMWEVSSLFENIGVVHDGMSMMAKPLEVVDHEQASTLKISSGKVDFDHVGFHYGRPGGIMEDFSLSIAAGEKVGVVGRSGAGKTTLMNLLLRFYDLEKVKSGSTDRIYPELPRKASEPKLGGDPGHLFIAPLHS